MPMQVSMLLIDGDQFRSAIVGAALREAGQDVAIVPKEMTVVRAKIAEARPQIIVDVEAFDRTGLNDLVSLSQEVNWPMAARVDHARPGPPGTVMAEGLSIYAVEGLSARRIRSIADITMKQLDIHSCIVRELDEARGEVIDRKTIVRARKILMTVMGLTEDDADRRLLHVAMKENRETFDVAQDLVRAIDQFDDARLRPAS
ncbi:ANTAR domain-containing response regulator [Roseixanthobacter glucoisosaccharinicivorans]|uniref:ANTAR domain-containing response regulator n=1 Tax=Roseixanthobacter glucoisosaccharinicivorans TaxID=3119923 RepID=UPI00372705F5